MDEHDQIRSPRELLMNAALSQQSIPLWFLKASLKIRA